MLNLYEIFISALPALVVLTLALLFLRRLVERRVVHETETALLFRNGRFVRVLESGIRLLFKPWDLMVTYDKRQNLFALQGQDLLSADRMSLKVSLALGYRITNARLLHESVAVFYDQLHQLSQLALRQAVSALTLEELLRNRGVLDEAITRDLKAKFEAMGVVLDFASVKDFMLSPELKAAFNQELKARQEGLAKLEQARSESAVLRNLANQGKLLRDNPELLKLRTLQALSDVAAKGGNTVVFGLPEGKGLA